MTVWHVTLPRTLYGKSYLEMTPEERAADRERAMGPAPGREGFWAHHNCSGCRDGFRPCRDGAREHCGRPRARND